ncbi:YfiH family protein [Oxalobacteraceae bacterium GrIS 1.11]
MSFLTPHWPDAPAGIGALTSLRGGGVSPAPYGDGAGGGGLNLGTHVGDELENVRRNRYLLQGVLPAEPAWLTQVHGSAVLETAGVVAASRAEAPQADASFTAARSAVCAVLTADCLPVLLCDAHGKVVAAAHAGWRGLAGGVLQQTVAAMRHAGAGEILAWLGPAIGPQQFEVGADVLQAFLDGAQDAPQMRLVKDAFAPLPGCPGKYLADIYALARIALRRDGVLRVAGGEFCTVTDAARFYSYRRDGVTGRQASLIWRK